MKRFIILCCAMIIVLTACASNKTATNNDNEKEEATYENPYKMEQLEDAFCEGDYATVEKLAKEIQAQYPDTLDESMAEIFLGMMNDKKTETETAVANIDFRNHIQIISSYTDAPNSAGGVDLHIKWKNTSNKTIKYITFDCNLYNAVDDMVACDIKNQYTFRGQVTGPIEPGTVYGDNRSWDNAWWNNSGKYPKIVGIEIEYMDGTIIEIPESRINELSY